MRTWQQNINQIGDFEFIDEKLLAVSDSDASTVSIFSIDSDKSKESILKNTLTDKIAGP